MIRKTICRLPDESDEYSFICKRFCDLRFMKGCVILCTLVGRMRELYGEVSTFFPERRKEKGDTGSWHDTEKTILSAWIPRTFWTRFRFDDNCC